MGRWVEYWWIILAVFLCCAMGLSQMPKRTTTVTGTVMVAKAGVSRISPDDIVAIDVGEGAPVYAAIRNSIPIVPGTVVTLDKHETYFGTTRYQVRTVEQP